MQNIFTFLWGSVTTHNGCADTGLIEGSSQVPGMFHGNRKTEGLATLTMGEIGMNGSFVTLLRVYRFFQFVLFEVSGLGMHVIEGGGGMNGNRFQVAQVALLYQVENRRREDRRAENAFDTLMI